jgi:hypothetical protein
MLQQQADAHKRHAQWERHMREQTEELKTVKGKFGNLQPRPTL